MNKKNYAKILLLIKLIKKVIINKIKKNQQKKNMMNLCNLWVNFIMMRLKTKWLLNFNKFIKF